jgi:hypothetical protein
MSIVNKGASESNEELSSPATPDSDPVQCRAAPPPQKTTAAPFLSSFGPDLLNGGGQR